MAIEIFNRVEKKYIMDESKARALIEHLKEHMKPDIHNKGDKVYSVSNIYYDTAMNDIIVRSLKKPVYKEKLRLRAYGVPQLNDFVFMELKKKYNGTVNKRRSRITLEGAYEFIQNPMSLSLKPYMNLQIMREIQYFLSRNQVEPAVYLSYKRLGYFDVNNPDFRVTFDFDVVTRRSELRLEQGIFGGKILPDHVWLMEVKALHTVPLWFAKLLSDMEIYPDSFSKYGAEFKKNIIENMWNGEQI